MGQTLLGPEEIAEWLREEDTTVLPEVQTDQED